MKEIIEMIGVEYPSTGETLYFSQEEIDRQVKIEDSFGHFWPTIKPVFFGTLVLFGSLFLFHLGLPPAFAEEFKQKGGKGIQKAGNEIFSNTQFLPTQNNPFPGGYIFDFRKKVIPVKKITTANFNQNFIRIFTFLDLKIFKEPLLTKSTETSVLVHNFIQNQKRVNSNYQIIKRNNFDLKTTHCVKQYLSLGSPIGIPHLGIRANFALLANMRGGFLGWGTIKGGKWVFDKLLKDKAGNMIGDFFKTKEEKQKEKNSNRFHIPNLPPELFVFLPTAFLVAFLIRDNKLPKPVEQVLVKTGLIPKKTFFEKIKSGIADTSNDLVNFKQPYIYVILLFLIRFLFLHKQEIFSFLKIAGENNLLLVLKLPLFLQELLFPNITLDSSLAVDNDPKFKALGGSDF